MLQPLSRFDEDASLLLFSIRWKDFAWKQWKRWYTFIALCYWKWEMVASSWWVGCVKCSRKKWMYVGYCACVCPCQLVCVDVWVMLERKRFLNGNSKKKHHNAIQPYITAVTIEMMVLFKTLPSSLIRTCMQADWWKLECRLLDQFRMVPFCVCPDLG